MSESFLVLHGLENHRPPAHWQHWLTERLRSRGHAVRYPGLPEPDRPVFADWAAALRSELAGLGAPPRTVICHSLACLLWLAVAAQLAPGERPERLLLVSVPDPAQVPPAGGDFRRGWDAAAVTASAQALRIVGSDGDPVNAAGAQAMYAEPLGCGFDLIPGAGHITPETGYGPWPGLEAWCERRAAAVAPRG